MKPCLLILEKVHRAVLKAGLCRQPSLNMLREKVPGEDLGNPNAVLWQERKLAASKGLQPFRGRGLRKILGTTH